MKVQVIIQAYIQNIAKYKHPWTYRITNSSPQHELQPKSAFQAGDLALALLLPTMTSLTLHSRHHNRRNNLSLTWFCAGWCEKYDNWKTNIPILGKKSRQSRTVQIKHVDDCLITLLNIIKDKSGIAELKKLVGKSCFFQNFCKIWFVSKSEEPFFFEDNAYWLATEITLLSSLTWRSSSTSGLSMYILRSMAD